MSDKPMSLREFSRLLGLPDDDLSLNRAVWEAKAQARLRELQEGLREQQQGLARINRTRRWTYALNAVTWAALIATWVVWTVGS